jgi:hypothetical protein
MSDVRCIGCGELGHGLGTCPATRPDFHDYVKTSELGDPDFRPPLGLFAVRRPFGQAVEYVEAEWVDFDGPWAFFINGSAEASNKQLVKAIHTTPGTSIEEVASRDEAEA